MAGRPLSPDAARLRRRRVRLRKLGLCLDCGGREADKPHALCANCLRDRRIRYYRKCGYTALVEKMA